MSSGTFKTVIFLKSVLTPIIIYSLNNDKGVSSKYFILEGERKLSIS